MRNLFIINVLFFVIFLSCEKSDNFLVNWSPLEPTQGQTIVVQYNPENKNAILKQSSNVNLIAEAIYPDSTISMLIPMKISDKLWTASIPTGMNVIFMGFKMEDTSGVTEDNDARGWNVLFRESSGRIVKNAYYNLGKTWDGSNRPFAVPYYVKALRQYSKELHNYPKNFTVYGAIWRNLIKISEKQKSTRGKNILTSADLRFLSDLEASYPWLRFDKNSEKIKARIVGHLDSLVKIYPKNETLLKLAFDVYRTLFKNKPKAIYYGEKLLIEFPRSSIAATVAYHLVYLKHGNSPRELINRLENFLFRYPNFRHKASVYLQLANSYLMIQNKTKAYEIFKKKLDANPDDFAGYLAVAKGLIEDKRYDEAKRYIHFAFDKCTLENLQKTYPWMKGLDRHLHLNIDKADIFSSLARIQFAEENYEKAIECRMNAIELGTPFPAYEWEGVGQAYLKMGQIEEAKNAFIEVLSLNSHQENALKALFQIYHSETGSDKGFQEYLRQALYSHRKKSVKIASDFEIRDLNDKVFRLSDNKGKIVVLYFWATAAEYCLREIPALNNLVLQFQTHPNVIFLAISIESKATAKNFLKDVKFIYHQCYSGGEVKEKLDVLGFPTHIIIDGNGQERFRQIGYKPGVEKSLADTINRLISESIL